MLIPTGRAAEILGVSPATILRAVHEGRLEASATTAGGHYRFSMEALRAYGGSKVSSRREGPSSFLLLSSKDVASRLGLSQATIVRAVQRGQIEPTVVTPGGHYRFAPKEIAQIGRVLNHVAEREPFTAGAALQEIAPELEAEPALTVVAPEQEAAAVEAASVADPIPAPPVGEIHFAARRPVLMSVMPAVAAPETEIEAAPSTSPVTEPEPTLVPATVEPVEVEIAAAVPVDIAAPAVIEEVAAPAPPAPPALRVVPSPPTQVATPTPLPALKRRRAQLSDWREIGAAAFFKVLIT